MMASSSTHEDIVRLAVQFNDDLDKLVFHQDAIIAHAEQMVAVNGENDATFHHATEIAERAGQEIGRLRILRARNQRVIDQHRRSHP